MLEKKALRDKSAAVTKAQREFKMPQRDHNGDLMTAKAIEL